MLGRGRGPSRLREVRLLGEQAEQEWLQDGGKFRVIGLYVQVGE